MITRKQIAGLWVLLWVSVACAADAPPSGGIGIAAATERGLFRVMQVAPNGPAAQAGLKAGDTIVAIDGKPVAGDPDPSTKVRGQPGTEVKLTIQRGRKTLEFSIRRAGIAPPPEEAKPTTPAPAAQNPLRNLPANGDTGVAPGWLKPGALITYSGSSGVVAASATKLQEDADGHIVDETGRHYSETDNLGGAGLGYTQTEIVAVSDKYIATESHNLVLMPGRFTVSPAIGKIGPPDKINEVWIHPDLLKKQPNTNTDGLHVYRQPYVLGGKTYHAVFTSLRNTNSWVFTIHDEETGLLLHLGMVTQEPSLYFSDEPMPRLGNRFLVQTTLVSVRQLHVPWQGKPLPPAAASAKRITYSGTETKNAGMAVHWPSNLELTVRNVTPDYISYAQRSSVNYGGGAPPQVASVERVSSEDKLLPLAIDTAALAALQSGQVLDHDPITQYNLTVIATGRGAGGKDVVRLKSSARALDPSSEMTYDKQTGLLMGISILDPGAYTRYDWALSGVQ